MPKKLPDELQDTFFAEHQAGKSYRRIALDHAVDWRTVKHAAEQREHTKTLDHWEQVSQRVDAQELQRHYQDLLVRAEVVQDVLVQDDPLNSQLHNVPPDYLEQRLQGRLLRKGGDLFSSSELEPVQRRRAQLLQDLYYHVPELEQALRGWETAWYVIHPLGLALQADAGAMLSEAGVPADEVASLATTAVVTAVCRVAEATSAMPAPLRHTTAAIEVAHGAAVNALEARLEGLPLIRHYGELLKQRQRVDAIIDVMVLRGIVDGECTVFPTKR